MFKKLLIEQFVIIDRLELELEGGLTILTGETGAGKSILLDATGLILGEPSYPESIRQGSDESLIKAWLAPGKDQPVWKFLTENNLVDASQTEFTIERRLRLAGEDIILFNERPVDVDLLKKVGTYLAEIHGQFANQSLLDPSNQLNLLDLSGGFPPEVFKNVADSLYDVRRYTKLLEEENTFLATHRRDMPRMEDIVKRFESIGMREGFIEEVKIEYGRLLTAKETSEAFQAILSQLIAANGGVMSLSSACETLKRNKNLDAEKMVTLSEYLNISLDNARAAVKEMRRIAPEYEIDTAPIYEYEEILAVLNKIGRENKIEYDNLEEFYNMMSGKVHRMRAGREKLAELQDLLAKAKRAYLHHAHILSEHRMAAGIKLSEEITSELAPLKLGRAEFKVLVEENTNIPWTERGLNVVTFTARMNPGMPFSPVAETASGGELARLILALKVVVQRVQTIPTLIFDEVDTGIGGAAAAAVGERLALLADNTQVLVITHSPQVASRGNQHLHVSKSTDGITTRSVVGKLTLDERTDEISRMLAGDVITPESKAAAQSLIQESKTAAEKRRSAAVPA